MSRYSKYSFDDNYKEPSINSSDLAFEQRIVEKVQLGVQRKISREMIIRYRSLPDFENGIAGDVVLDFYTFILACENKVEKIETKRETVKESHVLSGEYVPLTWWDHLKSTFSKWLKKRFLPYGEHRNYFKLRLKSFVDKVSDSVELRKIVTDNLYQTDNVQVTVNKHWHLCPHLDTDQSQSHFNFMFRSGDV